MASSIQPDLLSPNEEESPKLELSYTLAELPSSQHRAGLAGLILLIEWMRDTKQAHGGTIACDYTSQRSSITLDQEGMRALFQNFYAAHTVKVQSQSKWNGVEPLDIGEKEVIDPKSKKTKKQKYFVYEMIKPNAYFLRDLDPTDNDGDEEGIWIKLWRDMLWQTIRGRPTQRTPYNSRVSGARHTTDADKTWESLMARKPKPQSLSSTYYLGAQSVTSEQVPFEDHARFLFLLHFWPITAQVYVPSALDRDGDLLFNQGYVFAIPDVSDLKRFCSSYRKLMLDRGPDTLAYHPRQAVIDLPVEGALNYLSRVEEYLAREAGAQKSSLLGVDIIHINKEGHNVNVKGITRLEPNKRLLRDYTRIRDLYRSLPFRRQRLHNLVSHAPHWSSGFARLLHTHPVKELFDPSFQCDIKEAFKMTSGEHENENPWLETVGQEQVDMDRLVYSLVRTYLEDKIGAQLKKPSGEAKVEELTQEHKEWNGARTKLARKTFLAVRGRTGLDFVNYLTGTLCSVPQRLGHTNYIALSRVLRDDQKRDQLQNMTLLALSALGTPYFYSPNATAQDA